MPVLIKTSLPVKLYQNKNEKNNGFEKWYARVDNADQKVMGLEDLSAHIAQHGSIYTADVILGVMRKMVACVQELCLEGKKIKFDNLGIFSCQVANQEGAATQKAWKASNIKGIKLTFKPNRAGLNTYQRSILRSQVSIVCNGVSEDDNTTKNTEE